jgi:hypothetical protein
MIPNVLVSRYASAAQKGTVPFSAAAQKGTVPFSAKENA